MPDVCLSVRPSVRLFVTFYKMLQNSFVYEHKFTKLTQIENVYVNKGMSFITFGLILKNKMAAWIWKMCACMCAVAWRPKFTSL